VKITWTITKKHGNWRPVFRYQCLQEDWEVELRVPSGHTDNITIPISGDWYKYLQSLTTEEKANGETPPCKDNLSLPRWGEQQYLSAEYILPWRPGNPPQYPEIEAAMQALMAEWERRVLETIQSGACRDEGEVTHSPEFRQQLRDWLNKQ
jgi:hypothetical protein